jgi:hypothetical protein
MKWENVLNDIENLVKVIDGDLDLDKNIIV